MRGRISLVVGLPLKNIIINSSVILNNTSINNMKIVKTKYSFGLVALPKAVLINQCESGHFL